MAEPQVIVSNRMLRIGDVAPLFHARSTQGEIALSQYRGKWLIFFSHPADFTPVCTSEFVGLAKASKRFDAQDCALLGLSVDSLYAHAAWIRAINNVFGIPIDFPVIEDPSMAIGRAFGMIDENAHDSAAVRSTYFIDPKGVVRAITTYPPNVGRSVEEMLRLLSALQRADAGKVMTPEGWHPGDDVLLPPSVSDKFSEDADWFCKRVADK